MPTGIQIAPTLAHVGKPRASKDRYDEYCARSAREAIGRWVRESGITQEEAGKRLEVDQATISKWMRPDESSRPPTQPSLKSLIAFRRASGVSLDVALGLVQEEERALAAIRKLEARIARVETQVGPTKSEEEK